MSKLSGGPGKPMNIWPRKKSYYKVHSVPDCIKINPRFVELSFLKTFSNSFNFSFSVSEAQVLDRALAELVQAQSFSFWLLSSFFRFLEQEDFSPSNVALFNRFTSVISSVTQSQSNWTSAIQAFMILLRRKTLLSKTLPSVLQHQKDALLRSNVFSDEVFDDGVLEKILEDHSKAQVNYSQVQMVKLLASNALSKSPSPSYSGRGNRRPYFRPYSAPRGRGGRGGRGKGKSGFQPNQNKKNNNSKNTKNV